MYNQSLILKSQKVYLCHVPKVIVSAFGVEDGWDKTIGLKYEIVPLTKPFWTLCWKYFSRCSFKRWKPQANVEVEVGFYNEFDLKSPTSSHITQSMGKSSIKMEFSLLL